MKKFIITILLLASATAHAVDLIPIQRVSFFSRVLSKIQECTWRIPCYWEKKLGVSLTAITGATLVSDLDTVLTTNFDALNDGKIENSTTSVAAITTLSNLVTVGTLTSGSLGSGFTAVVSAIGGTGSTTLSSNQVLLGNGTGNITVVNGWGTSGQFLTSGGGVAAPTWTTSAIDEAGNYTWTGTHIFSTASTVNATTTNLFSVFASSTRAIIGSLGIGVSTTTASSSEIGGDVYIRGSLSVGGNISGIKGIYSAVSIENRSTDVFAAWSATSSASANLQIPIPVTGKIKNLYAKINAPNGGASGESVSVYINGAVSSSTPFCKFTNGNGVKTCSDLSTSANVSAGDYINFLFDTGDSSSETAWFSATVQYQ